MTCTASTAPREREFIGHDDDGSPIYGRRLLGAELRAAIRRLFAGDVPSKPCRPRVAIGCSNGTPSVEGAATASSADESAAESDDGPPPGPAARPRLAPALNAAALGAGAFA